MQDSSDARVAQLRMYLARGWALVPLHDVGDGVCSCRLGAACRSAGKHPRAAEWQRPEHLVRDEAGLAAALARWPSCNWGLATGLISGCWALDYDPKSVDPARATEVDAIIGQCLAAAAFVQRTGSGGMHFVFALPEDFVPNNGTGGLPPGLDVRGARRGEAGGGQIVLAPSVSGTGVYQVLHDRGGPLTLAPEVVTAMVRPAPPRQRVAPASIVAVSSGQAAAYVAAAVNGVVEKLRAAPVGTRNNAAITTAYRLIELMNTGLVDRDAAYAAWWAAGMAHPEGVIVPESELAGVWGRAERHVGDAPADLSGVGGPSGWWGGDVVHFGHAPSVAPPDGGLSAAGGATGYPQGVHGAADNDRTSPDIAGQGPDIDPVTAMIARMLTPEQLDERPNPEPLVNGVLDLDTCTWLIGASGSFKSFVALDLAAHVGRGEAWRGHAVRQGLVIYVVAEGDRGMKLRQAAWRREYGPLKDVLFLPEPVQADERRTPGVGAWSVLVEACRRLRPALVIIDTQARVTIGLKENDNSDMSYYADQADRLKRATGACVLTVHHLGRSGGDARGASSIDAAQDAELKVERNGKSMTCKLIVDKQKDQAEGTPTVITMRRSDGGTDPQTGRDLSSLVLEPFSATVPQLGEMSGTKQDIGRRRALALFQLLHDLLPGGGEGITRAEIRALFYGLPEIAALGDDGRRKAWVRAWALLLQRGRVMRYGSSQRFAVFPPPDGAADGMLTSNSGGPDDAPPDGWTLHSVVDDKVSPDDHTEHGT